MSGRHSFRRSRCSFELAGYLDDLGMHEAAVKLGKAMDPLLDALGFTPEEVSDASQRKA